MLKKIGIGFLVTLLLTVSIAGVVLADNPEPSTEDCGPWCTRFSGLAEALGMDSEEVTEALKAGKTVAELAEEQGLELGDLVDALVNPHIAAMKERLLDRFQSGDALPFHGDRFSFGESFGGRFGRMPHGGMSGILGPRVDPLSEVLGLSMDEVMAALQDGKTIAELAEEQGVALEDLADALADNMAEHMRLMVESGHLTQEELEARIDQMREMILNSLESGTGRFAPFLGHREGCDEEMMGHRSFRMPRGGMQGFRGEMRGFEGRMRGFLPNEDADAEPSGFRGRSPATSSL